MHCMCLCVQNLCYILFKYYIKHKSLSLSLSLSLSPPGIQALLSRPRRKGTLRNFILAGRSGYYLARRVRVFTKALHRATAEREERTRERQKERTCLSTIDI